MENTTIRNLGKLYRLLDEPAPLTMQIRQTLTTQRDSLCVA